MIEFLFVGAQTLAQSENWKRTFSCQVEGTQCDQKCLGDTVSYKISPNIGQLFVQFKKPIFLHKNCFASFLGNFGENWATFNSIVWTH